MTNTATQDLDQMTPAQLRDYAGTLGLTPNPRAPKPALLRMIRAHENQGQGAAKVVPAATFSNAETQSAEAVRSAVGAKVPTKRKPKALPQLATRALCVSPACEGKNPHPAVWEAIGHPTWRYCENGVVAFEERQRGATEETRIGFQKVK